MGTFTRKQDGETIDYTNGGVAAIAYGDPVVIGNNLAVAAATIAVGLVGAVAISGVYQAASVTNAAFAIGDKLYWDADNTVLTKTPTAVIAGICVATKATSTATARVALCACPQTQAANVTFTPYDAENPDAQDQAIIDILASLKAAGIMAPDAE